MNLYLALKVVHVASAFVFFAGVVAVNLFLTVAGTSTPPPQIIHGVRRWDRRVVQPAMLLAWAMGIGIASMGGWFVQGWLMAKIGLVVALSALHGVQGARLRRLAGGAIQSTPRWLGSALLLTIFAIVLLVLMKPHASA